MNEVSIRIAAAFKTLQTRVQVWQEGATAAEYALLVALIAVAIIGGATLLGGSIKDAFSDTGNHIANKTSEGINAG
ncbi:MAG: Flp family type IVb pilin [Acidimicrobiia bacterium]|nr:Flp family type IVb pilin [Acidimicrobiia bacterium]